MASPCLPPSCPLQSIPSFGDFLPPSDFPSFDGADAVTFSLTPLPSYQSIGGIDVNIFNDLAPPPSYPILDAADAAIFNDLAPPPSYPIIDAADAATVNDLAPPPSYSSSDSADAAGIFELAPPPSYPSSDSAAAVAFYLAPPLPSPPSYQSSENFEFASPVSYPSFDGGEAVPSGLAVLPPCAYDGVDVGALISVEDCGYTLIDEGGEDWKASLPPGVKFRPTDEELVIYYLLREFVDASSAPTGIIAHVDVYDYEPHQLIGMGVDHGDGKMYFYTRIKKIGKSKTDRSIKSKKGSWKPTQAPKPIRGGTGKPIAYKTPLAYYEGKKKTQWLMQEFKLDSQTSTYSAQELVLVVIYYLHRGKRDGGVDC